MINNFLSKFLVVSMPKVTASLFNLSLIFILSFTSTTKARLHHLPQNNFECPDEWGYYEDAENCIKYYKCEFGKPESITCRIGML